MPATCRGRPSVLPSRILGVSFRRLDDYARRPHMEFYRSNPNPFSNFQTQSQGDPFPILSGEVWK